MFQESYRLSSTMNHEELDSTVTAVVASYGANTNLLA